MKELLKFGGSVSKKKSAITGVIGGVILLLLWFFVASLGIVSPKILPNPVDVITCIPGMISEDNLFGNITYTVGLNLLGYIYALVVAIPIGFLIGIFPLPRAMFQKPIEAIRFLPLPAISGVMVAMLGIGFGMKASFLALGILIYMLPVITQRIYDLQDPNNPKDNVYLQTAKTIGLNNWQIFWRIYVPFVMSKIYGDIRSLVAISYTYVTIAENINKDGGIGALINTMTRQSHIDCVYALLLIIILIGILQDQIIKFFEPLIFKFKK